MNGPLLEAENLRFRQGGRLVLDIPSISLSGGEALAVVGPNGAGKSSLVMCLSGLWTPQEGEIHFSGQKIGADLLAYRRQTAVVFQEPLLFDATVYENVAVGLRLRKIKDDELHHRVHAALRRFKIEKIAERGAKNLSGGEAKRAGLARAFACDPKIVFLDEPFSALDPPTREALLEDFQESLGDIGATALLVTHDLNEALRLCDRLFVMKAGRVVQSGPPEEVVNRPVDQFVASFVGMETLLKGVVTKSEDGLMEIEVCGSFFSAVGDADAGELVLFGVRPENVTLSLASTAKNTSARNNFFAKVTRVTNHGAVSKVEMDAGFPLCALVTSLSARDLCLAAGAEVIASVKTTSLHIIKS